MRGGRKRVLYHLGVGVHLWKGGRGERKEYEAPDMKGIEEILLTDTIRTLADVLLFFLLRLFFLFLLLFFLLPS